MSLATLGGLRIAQLIESDGPGGAEQVVVDLATRVQRSGAHSVVFVPANGEGWLARQLAGSGVVVELFRLQQPVSPACARGLAAAFRRHRVNLAHSHEFSMAVYGASASWFAGVPHVITMHGGRYYAGRLQRRFALRVAMALSARTVAVSRPLAQHLSRDLRVNLSRIAMIPNGVGAPPRVASAVREELGLQPWDRLLVCVGNLYPVKGHGHAIDALARLAARWPTLRLAIAGRGELAGALAERARAGGVADRVHFLGLRSDVPAVLRAADVFVLPSLSEGLPLALLEAMFAGAPIVASEVGEVGPALGHGDAGVLVPPGDAAALAAALDALLSDPDRARRLGERAAARAAAEYDVSQMVTRYARMYCEVTARHRVTAGPRPVSRALLS